MCAFVIASTVLLLTRPVAIGAEASGGTLLTTAVLARQIRDLQGPRADMPTNPMALKARVAALRRDIRDFITRQIEAYPSISECELQKQLTSAFSIEMDKCGAPLEDSGVPRVFAQSWGPGAKRRTFVVTYQWFGFYGENGSQTILESYVWDRDGGVHRGAGLIPAAFNGVLTTVEQVCWFPVPDRYWVLVFGTVGGPSGRVIGGTAAVVEAGPEAVKIVWSAPPFIGDVQGYVFPMSRRWEIEYVDANRIYANLPQSSFVDMYQIDSMKATFRRLVHQPLN